MEIVLYTTSEGNAQFRLQKFDDQIWLSQIEMAELYQTTKQNISKHIKAIFSEGELDENSTVNYKLTVQTEGSRTVSRQLAYYSLPLIIAVGYRVRSSRGTQFRQWATERLQEYMVKVCCKVLGKSVENKLNKKPFQSIELMRQKHFHPLNRNI